MTHGMTSESCLSSYGQKGKGVEKPCSQAGQEGSRCEAREKSTSGGVLRQYVGATPMGAEMISAAIESDYPRRLLSAGWRQMGLFQRSGVRVTGQGARELGKLN